MGTLHTKKRILEYWETGRNDILEQIDNSVKIIKEEVRNAVTGKRKDRLVRYRLEKEIWKSHLYLTFLNGTCIRIRGF